MERYSMFLGWKNQYHENDSTTYAIYRFNVILVRLPNTFLTELDQNTSQSVWKHRDSEWTKQSWERRMKLEESAFLPSANTTKLQPQGSMALIQKQIHWSVEQDRKLRDKHDEGVMDTQWGNEGFFNKCCWKIGQRYVKQWNLEPFLTPHTKINSKWIKDLNVRSETIKTLRGKHRQKTQWHKLQHGTLWSTS